MRRTETPTEAMDDTVAFAATHQSALLATSTGIRPPSAAVKADCIYAQAHRIKASYVLSVCEVAQ